MRLSHRALVVLGGVCTKARAANLKDQGAGCALSLVQPATDFREGDWVWHRSYPDPIRVIGTGTTIAVRFPDGKMQVFEPCELERVQVASVPVRKVQGRE